MAPSVIGISGRVSAVSVYRRLLDNSVLYSLKRVKLYPANCFLLFAISVKCAVDLSVKRARNRDFSKFDPSLIQRHVLRASWDWTWTRWENQEDNRENTRDGRFRMIDCVFGINELIFLREARPSVIGATSSGCHRPPARYVIWSGRSAGRSAVAIVRISGKYSAGFENRARWCFTTCRAHERRHNLNNIIRHRKRDTGVWESHFGAAKHFPFARTVEKWIANRKMKRRNVDGKILRVKIF